MSNVSGSASDDPRVSHAIEVAIKVAIVIILIVLCYRILKPFLIPILWGIIIAVASHPLYVWLEERLGGRRKLASVLLVFAMFLILIVPTMILAETLIEGARNVAAQLKEGELDLPEPSESLLERPIIGPVVARFWNPAELNLEETLSKIQPEIKAMGNWLIGTVSKVGIELLRFVFAIIIAGVLLYQSAKGKKVADELGERLVGRRGKEFAQLAQGVVRSVAQGILGVALIQAILAGLCFVIFGIPGAGLWALICLITAIIQLGVAPVALPLIIYMFVTRDTSTAIVFTVCILPVGLIDNVLKPLLLGRGVKVPMILIFAGAIGGFMAWGIVGLFVGAVLLVLGRELLIEWMAQRTGIERDKADRISSPRVKIP